MVNALMKSIRVPWTR